MRYNTTKRDPIKNSFIMPNEIFRLGLSEGAIAMYAYLLYCEDRDTYQCYQSYTTIAGAVNKSKNSIRKYVAELVARRLIETEHTTVTLKDGRKHNGSLKLYNSPDQRSSQISRRGSDAETENRTGKAGSRKTSCRIRSSASQNCIAVSNEKAVFSRMGENSPHPI